MGRITIIIPTKNEEENIGNLLSDLQSQQTEEIEKIIVSDNSSSDSTRKIASTFSKARIPVELIDGGIPSVARNRGAEISSTDFIVFIDADVRIHDRNLIQDCLESIGDHHLLTCKIRCKGDKIADEAYKMNNRLMKLSKYYSPFCPGIFMFWNRKTFEELGKFDEEIHFSEDYQLSRKVKGSKFKILRNKVYTDPRRFHITGYKKLMKMMILSFIHRDHVEKVKGDKGYWNHLDI